MFSNFSVQPLPNEFTVDQKTVKNCFLLSYEAKRGSLVAGNSPKGSFITVIHSIIAGYC